MNNKTLILKESQTLSRRRQEYDILVIHPWDASTDFLSIIYRSLDCTVIRHPVSDEFLLEQMEKADQIIALGHGTPEEGLLDSNYSKVFKAKAIPQILREKKIPGVFIWCYADSFVHRHNIVSQFYTEMFISEISEAETYNINTSEKQIELSNASFAAGVGQAIQRGSKNEFADYVKGYYLSELRFAGFGALAKFNVGRFFQSDWDFEQEIHPAADDYKTLMPEVSGYGKLSSPDEQKQNMKEEPPAIVVENEQ